MESLGLFPLSVILSFLQDTDGAVALLLTQRRYARQVLPLFQLPCSANDAAGLVVLGAQPQVKHKNRHRFVVAPVQDPIVLLERLNTRRLAQRRRRKAVDAEHFCWYQQGLSTSELALKEWNEQLCHSSCKLELLRFADRTTRLHDAHCQALYEAGTTLLVSYPRSGNTLVRTLLERTTGIVTGSDTRPDRSLSKELAEQHGLVGEGQQLSCCFVKSHWPERIGNRPIQGHRAVLLVRNPYDTLDSYWNMNATKSHTQTLAPSVYQMYQNKWQGLVRNEIHVWMKFLDFWIRDCPVPVLLVRYEDLIRDPAQQLARILAFALTKQQQHSSSQQPLNNFWRQRIAHVVSSSTTTTSDSNNSTQSNTEQLGSYRPRSSGAGILSVGKSLHRGHYSAELLDYIHQASAEHPYTNYLRAFGYDMIEQGFPNNFVDDNAAATATFTTEPNVVGSNNNYINNSLLNYALMQSTSDTVRLNDRASEDRLARPVDCPYGRLLQKWRHSVTDNDAVPLPVE